MHPYYQSWRPVFSTAGLVATMTQSFCNQTPTIKYPAGLLWNLGKAEMFYIPG